MAALVESHNRSDQRWPVQDLRVFLCGQKHDRRLQLVNIQGIGELEGALLEIFIDRVLDVGNRDLA
jgi:hypothetical protein